VKECKEELIDSDDRKEVVKSTMFSFFFLRKRKGWRNMSIREINIFISLDRY